MRKTVVVAPTFNEVENVGSFIAEVLKQGVEVLISDSHSADGTIEIVRDLAKKNKKIHLLDVEKRGLGLGLTKGLDYAVNELKAEVIITMEADLSCNPKQIPQFLKKMENADVVIGSRYIKGGSVGNWSWWRRAFSLGANLVLWTLAGMPRLREFTNLYRAFSKEVWLEVRPKIKMHTGWLFVPAFAFEILGRNYNLVELPITYFDRFGGRSKMRTLSYTKNLLHYALRFRAKKLGIWR